jgi:hypothetical protein
MTDLHDVLDSVAGQQPSPTPDVVAADLRRGRRALLHRRWARGSAVALAGAAAVAALAFAPGYVGGNDEVQVVTPATGSQPADPPNPGVDLVAFDAGANPKPLSPGEIPAGWTVSGSEYALVIAPSGSTTSPDDFRGKLVVMVSPDQTAAPGATSIDVAGTPGTFSVEDGTQILIFTPDGGRQVVVQAPAELGWDDATVARFASAVTVSADAKAGRG